MFSHRFTIVKLGLAAAVLCSSATAFAAHDIIVGPRSDAFASSATHQGPHVVGSAAHIVNGVAIPQDTYAGNAGAASGGGSAGQSWASTSQDGGFNNVALHNEAYAFADLATGTLKATTSSTGPNTFGSPLGFAQARLDDTIFFTNSSGGALTVGFTYSFDGVMTDPFDSNPGGSVSLTLMCTSSTCANDAGDRIVYGTGPARIPNETWQYLFNMKSSCFGENIYCGQGAAPYFQWGLNQPNANGIVDGWITTSLVIPTGESSIGISGRLNLDCRGGSSCDFGHTGLFRFGDLPAGLDFSSASGLFLTGLGQSAVPEPATWAMMVLGFGLIGSMARRRNEMRFAATGTIRGHAA